MDDDLTFGDISFADISFDLSQEDDESEILRFATQEATRIQSDIGKMLPPTRIISKPSTWHDGSNMFLISFDTVVELANEIFGQHGWHFNVRRVTMDFVDRVAPHQYDACVSAVVRVQLKDGSHHEDIGCSSGDDFKSRKEAIDILSRRAVCDGIKRCFRQFGDVLGNFLYRKDLPELFAALQASNSILVDAH